MALGHLGITSQVANYLTERSAEAMAARKFFEPTRDATLRDFNWPLAKKHAELALIEEDPNEEWGFSYRTPTDCLAPRRILSGDRNDTRDSRVPFLESSDNTGGVIFCDRDEAILEYTKKMDNTSFYPADYAIALSYRLAAIMAPALTAGDPFRRGDSAMQMYDMHVSRAKANALNSEQVDKDPETDSIKARDT